jgi:hypothetical protein
MSKGEDRERARMIHLGGGRHALSRWGSSDALRAAEWTLARLADLGIDTAAPNRLADAVDLIRRTNAIEVQYDVRSSTALAVSEAIKVAFEQYLIVSKLHHIDGVAQKKLRLMLRGDLTPAQQDDPGRDTQTELFAGVVFRAAGYRVDIAEPDLVISKGTGKWGVAVKRVKSERQLTARIRSAQGQLQRHRLDGFIVVNPELLMDQMLREARLSHDELSTRLYSRIADLTNKIDGSDPSNRVLAIMALATVFAPVKHHRTFRFDFGVFIHQCYVTGGKAGSVAAIKRVGDAMFAAINRVLTVDAKPPKGAA